MINSVAPLGAIDRLNVMNACERQRNPKKALIKNHIAQVSQGVADYRVNLRDGLVSKIAFNDNIHDAYYSLYDSKSAEVVSILSDVWSLNEELSLCPYCLVDTAEHLDHYFPRSVFPELSISSQNLIPACGICNSGHKKTLWENSPNRMFFHPYFDHVPAEQFLFCDIEVNQAKVFKISYEVKPLAGESAEVNRLIASHFNNLALSSRYVAKATSVEVPKIGKLLDSRQGGEERLKALSLFVGFQIETNPVNTLEHAFYTCLASMVGHLSRL